MDDAYPRVYDCHRLHLLNKGIGCRALEQLEFELKKNPQLLSLVSVSATADLIARLKAKLETYLIYTSALEEG